MKNKVLRMDSNDNVATVLAEIEKGEDFLVLSSEGDELESLIATDNLRFGFKVALSKIREGEMIIKYGLEIGRCYKNIEKGELVHIHNIRSNRISIPQERIEQMVKDMGI